MAKLGVNPVSIVTPAGTYTANSQATTKLNLYHMVSYTSSAGGSDFFHFKTNIPTNSGFMGMIEFVGANYGDGMLPIRSAVGFYCYGATNSVINVAIEAGYPYGMQPFRVYKSSDSYAVICVNVNSYFTGYVLNSYTSNPTTPGFDVQILAVAQTTNDTAVY